MLERSELDFTIVEGVFDKEKYSYHLFKKENFVGVCSKKHFFAGKIVRLEDTFYENVVVQEKGPVRECPYNKLFQIEDVSIISFNIICCSDSNGNSIPEWASRLHAVR